MGAFKSFDYISFVATIFLLGISLLIIYSISLVKESNVDASIFSRQLLFCGIGIAFYLFFSMIDYRNLKGFSYIFYAISVVLILITYLIGSQVRGSTRWIDLGFFQIQSSEFMKVSLILTLASYFSTRSARSFRNLIVPSLLSLFAFLLIYAQPDLGSAIVTAGIYIAIVFASGLKMRIILATLALGLIISPLFYNSLQDYQKQRLITFMNPSSDPLGSGYNVIQSMIAVGSGQITGKGFGRGTQSHYNFLPEHHTDFIFAAISEELGLVGSAIVVITATILILRLINIAGVVNNSFGSLILVGVSAQLALQFFINIGMNIGILPVTGITLPLISYGGSSLIAILATLGIAQSVYTHKDD